MNNLIGNILAPFGFMVIFSGFIGVATAPAWIPLLLCHWFCT